MVLVAICEYCRVGDCLWVRLVLVAICDAYGREWCYVLLMGENGAMFCLWARMVLVAICVYRRVGDVII